MACNRGAASPNTLTRLKLFSDSGGHCQNPACLTDLFLIIGESHFHIAEMAHIFSASDDGPRANEEMVDVDRGHYQNLILLCPSCHLIIDKAEKEFPDSLIRKWKNDHKVRIDDLFGVVIYQGREETRLAIDPLLAENRVIFETYGPELDYKYNPESDIPILWRRKIITKILPNNRKILKILSANRKFLTEIENFTFEVFSQHVDDFEARHLEGVEVSGVRFPKEMDSILK